MLKVTDSRSFSDSTWGSIEVAAPCPLEGADTLATLWASVNRDHDQVFGLLPTVIDPCGLPGIPGSNPGDPPGPQGTDTSCGWYRDFVVFWTVPPVWFWLGGWYYDCPLDQIRTAILSSFESSDQIAIRLLGPGPLPSKQRVMIERDTTTGIGAFISVDTTSATAADLEMALVGAKMLYAKRTPRGSTVYGRVIPVIKQEPNRQTADYVKAVNALRSLKSAPVGKGRSGTRARVIDITVKR